MIKLSRRNGIEHNSWAVPLATAVLFGLVPSGRSEEAPVDVGTAPSATTLSGYLDTSAHWNFGTGNANLPPNRFNSSSKADGFNINVVQLRIERPLDEIEWATGYHVDFWMGPDANLLGTESALSTGTGDFAIRQAYVTLRTPLLNGIEWKVGVFDCPIGYETVESPSNPNFTRSYDHSIEPQTETGVLASYRFNEMVSASFGVADTIGPKINDRAFLPESASDSQAESYKSYMGAVTVTVPDSLGFLAGSTLCGGIVTGFNPQARYMGGALGTVRVKETAYFAGATVTTPVRVLRFGTAFDYIDIHQAAFQSSGSATWSVAGYTSLQATEKFSFHARAEYLKDKNMGGGQGFLFTDLQDHHAARVLSLTATMQYDLWKDVISRLELRWDHSLTGDSLFGGDILGQPMTVNAWLLAANMVYRF